MVTSILEIKNYYFSDDERCRNVSEDFYACFLDTLNRIIVSSFILSSNNNVNRQLFLNSFLRAIDKSSPWVVGTRCCVVLVVTNMLKPVVFALVENSYWLLVIGCYHFHLYS